MAKKQEEEAKALVPSSTNQVPADFGDDWVADAGAGFSHEAEDSLVPILGIVQENSGEVKKKGPKYVEGIEPGMLIIRSMGKTFSVEKDETALLFQPCAFMHVWIEWQGEPGDGIPVNRFMFNDPPPDRREVSDPQNAERKMWVRENGNRLVETREHYGHVILPEGAIPVVLPMAGTNHKTSRELTNILKFARLPTPKGPMCPPGWFKQVALTTKYQQRGTQSWYKLAVKDAGFVQDKALRDAGKTLYESVSTGAVTAKMDDLGADADAASGDTEAPI